MKNRRKIYGSLLICALLLGFSVSKSYAQYMPVVYDRSYGENIEYQHFCTAHSGEVMMVGTNNGRTTLTWIKRDGEIEFSRTLPIAFTVVNDITYIGNDQVLITGQANSKSKGKQAVKVCGRLAIVDNTGNILGDVEFGGEGSELYKAEILADGNIVVGGCDYTAAGSRAGLLGKVSPDGKTIYKYVSNQSGSCVAFDVRGSEKETVNVAFTGEQGRTASVVRLDAAGKTSFITTLPDADFRVVDMKTTAEGTIILIGNSPETGGRILKLRTEGDIVFNKEIVPLADMGAGMTGLRLADNGNIFVGGNGADRCYYSLLRDDGTELQKYVLKGRIAGMDMDPVTGESIITGFDVERGRGSIIGLSKDGRQMYQKSTDANFDKLKMVPNGILLAGTSTGRISMVSNMGDLLFDRYAIEDNKDSFQEICFSSNGDVLLKNAENRMVKLGHGVYVSDIKINKPVNGYTTAFFTVTLTGYSTNEQGVPVPVTVDYFTKDGTATEKNNYSPVKGSLSFVPSNDGALKFMIKQEVEVPIKANNLLEGRKLFEMRLDNVKQSYFIKPSGTGMIEDHEAYVKFVSTEDGLEDERDVMYELGIFKTNGEPLVNATGSAVVIDGIYGKGTADALDFDMGIIPRLSIENGRSTGKFGVKTLSDTRYELPKTVVIDFNKIHAISDANIGFESKTLTCTGTIIDQPAMVAISSLGDHGRLNNIVSGLFKISLVRASDGELLTNATGSDIGITCSVSSETSAAEGRDFVLTNMHDLRIWGDGNRSAVNLNGIVLYNADKSGQKNLFINIDSVSIPAGAPYVHISPDEKTAGFIINE